MSYTAKVLKVLIASPSDVANERNIVRDVLASWNSVHSESRKIVLLPIGWETHSVPEMGDRAQALINKRIAGCDLLVGIFWTRLGTDTGEFPSGTVEEIENHVRQGKHAMLYFSDAPVVPASINIEQYTNLKAFKDGCSSRGLYAPYIDAADFRAKFDKQLQITLNDTQYIDTPEPIRALPAPQALPGLSSQAKLLLKTAGSGEGQITYLRHLSGIVIDAGKGNLSADGNPRSLALWEGAIGALERARLIQPNAGRNIFRLTTAGYEAADQLP